MEYLDYTLTKKNIIELLKKLGYKSIYLMDLYSEWIYEIMNYLQSINSRDEIYSCKEYIACIKNGLSQYYVWLVREGMWLGIIPFHSSMEKMVDEIDYSLADCDMRRGRLHKAFGLPNENGFSNLLISDINNYKSYIQKTEIKNLSVITMGTIPPNPAELVASSKNEKLMEIFKEEFDIIIYDCVPITGLTDSLIMSKLVDKTVIVAASKVTPIELLQNTKKSLLNVGANIAGVVFNRVETDTGIYANKYYGKYYHD